MQAGLRLLAAVPSLSRAATAYAWRSETIGFHPSTQVHAGKSARLPALCTCYQAGLRSPMHWKRAWDCAHETAARAPKTCYAHWQAWGAE